MTYFSVNGLDAEWMNLVPEILPGDSNSCSAISVGAAGLAVAAARCLPRLTRSPRFRLMANAPLGHHSDHSPRHCLAVSGRSSDLPVRHNKKADHRKGDPFFVEHRRFELLTPTLPVLCATNCANAPNRWYIIIEFSLCKALFSGLFFCRKMRLNNAEA